MGNSVERLHYYKLRLVKKIPENKDFYDDCSKIAKTRYKECFSENEYKQNMKQIIGKITNETN